ncbi:hypothetical protein AAX27_01232 [Aliarcobacter thereius]|nr:hypothetical protein AAX27_01232 [Aliarcobacter thereius]
MFCKECGTENLDIEVECKKCKIIINSNLPLDGTERVMIIGFFVGLAATIFFGIIPIIICLGLIYIIKKDKSIKSLETAKKVFLGYLVILGLILSIIVLKERATFYESTKEYYDKYQKTNDMYYLREYDRYKQQSPILLATGLIVVPLGTYLIYFISNILFFNILKRHSQWISSYGLFTDYKGEKSFIEKTTEKIQTIKKEPLNTTDELLKWAELKEKGLITDEEFQKAKEKILEGKL